MFGPNDPRIFKIAGPFTCLYFEFVQFHGLFLVDYRARVAYFRATVHRKKSIYTIYIVNEFVLAAPEGPLAGSTRWLRG
jgi:hypothetical protein